MVIVTFSGKAESGKDLSASLFKREAEKNGKKVFIIHYADYLKFIAQKYFGWDGNKDIKGRELLQQLGTNIIRERDYNFWARSAMEFIRVFALDYDYFLVPDCRFPNEVHVLKEVFAFVIPVLVIRENYQNSLTEEQRNHSSEIAMDDFKFDYIVSSETGEDNLSPKIIKLINDIERKIAE